jgi:hypothetical protein
MSLSNNFHTNAINTIRFLSADAVQNANSGILCGIDICGLIQRTLIGQIEIDSFFLGVMVLCYCIVCCIYQVMIYP